jgi:hypothetical protein
MIRGICTATFPLILLVSLLPGAQTAFACSNGKLLFEDKFQTLDLAWGIAPLDSSHSVGADGLVYNLAPSTNFVFLSQTSYYDNYEVCAQFSTKFPEKANVYVGLAFWGSDNSNVYELDVFPGNGNYAVFRAQGNKYLKPVPFTVDPAVVKDQNGINELSTTVNGNHAVVSINGKKVAEFNGIAPDGGSLVGLNIGADKGDTGPSVVTIKDFQVRALP